MKKDGSIGFGLQFGMFVMCAGLLMIILLTLFLTLFLTGCSLNKEREETSIGEGFRGGWNCEESPLENPEAYTGYFLKETDV